MTIEQLGSRLYVVGDGFPVREQLKRAGCHWDAARKQWWIGTARRAAVEPLLSYSRDEAETVPLDAPAIRGRVSYRGKTYYLLADGVGRTGKPYAKLCYRDGTRVFWAAAASLAAGEMVILKRYEEPRSIQSLRDYAQRRRAEDRGDAECPVCARLCTCGTAQFCRHHHDGCDRCGVEG